MTGIQITLQINTTKRKVDEDISKAKKSLLKVLDSGVTEGTFKIDGVKITIDNLVSGI